MGILQNNLEYLMTKHGTNDTQVAAIVPAGALYKPF